MNRLSIILVFEFLFLIRNEGTAQTVVLNEISYSNKSILYDIDGETPDWFEIYNKSNVTVDLKNYQVTDDTSKTEYWSFPDYELAPGGYLVVFASGKDIKDTRQFHTDFKLGLMEDPLYLLNPSGDIIDKIDITCVPADYSLGRVPDGSEALYVITPTPENSNNNSHSIAINYLPDSLSVNYQSGFYNEPVKLEFSNKISGNVIMYSLDGDMPDADAEIYEEGIVLEDLTSNENRFANIPETGFEPGNLIFKADIVRAIVYSAGCPASNEICNTYFIGDDLNGKYKVPVVSLITEKDNLFGDEIGIYVSGNHNNYNQHGKEWERPVHIEIFDTLGNQVIDQNCGIRIHGRGSRGAPQKSFRLYSRYKYGKEYFEYPFFEQKPEIEKFKTLVLRSTRDWSGTLFKDELCQYLVQDMNIDYTACQTVVTFINGEYWGIYSLRERQDRYYIENNYRLTDANPDIIGYDMDNIIIEDGSLDAYTELINFIENTNPESEGFYKGISNSIDIDGLIDYFIVQLYLANTDFPKVNLELWKLKNDTSKWRYFFFDLDAAMYRIDYDHLSEYNNQIDEYQRFPYYTTYIVRNLLNNEDFRNLFYCKFNHHLSTTLSTGTVLNNINHFEKLYSPLISEHAYRWHNPVDFVKWEDNVDVLKEFAVQRPVVMAQQLQDNFGNPFIVFPNPSNGIVNIQFYGYDKPFTIKIFNCEGILLKQLHTPVNNEISLETSLAPGMYFMQIQIEGMLYSEKLIIQ